MILTPTLGIDMGVNCGWVYAESMVPQLWGTDVIDYQGEVTMFQAWRDWLEHKLRTYRPKHLVYERPFISRNASSQSLLQREGILMLVAEDFGIDFWPVAVPTLKKTLTGNGNASKEDMIRFVEKNFGIVCETDHEADAIACVFWGAINISEE